MSGTLWAQVLLSKDADFTARCGAAAARSPNLLGQTVEPLTWAQQHDWQIAASPGFADAYWYALENGVAKPGRDPAVISDEDVEAAVQAELNRWRAAG